VSERFSSHSSFLIFAIADQLFDAGSSIGANLEESQAAYSRRELAAKSTISLKESRESKYWLRVAQANRWATRIFENGCCKNPMNSSRCLRSACDGCKQNRSWAFPALVVERRHA
jgi:hypothetical protein